MTVHWLVVKTFAAASALAMH